MHIYVYYWLYIQIALLVYVHILSITLQTKSLKNIKVKQFNYCHIII